MRAPALRQAFTRARSTSTVVTVSVMVNVLAIPLKE